MGGSVEDTVIGYQCTKERLKGEGEKPETEDWVE